MDNPHRPGTDTREFLFVHFSGNFKKGKSEFLNLQKDMLVLMLSMLGGQCVVE
jgi:hypothetical protein